MLTFYDSKCNYYLLRSENITITHRFCLHNVCPYRLTTLKLLPKPLYKNLEHQALVYELHQSETETDTVKSKIMNIDTIENEKRTTEHKTLTGIKDSDSSETVKLM